MGVSNHNTADFVVVHALHRPPARFTKVHLRAVLVRRPYNVSKLLHHCQVQLTTMASCWNLLPALRTNPRPNHPLRPQTSPIAKSPCASLLCSQAIACSTVDSARKSLVCSSAFPATHQPLRTTARIAELLLSNREWPSTPTPLMKATRFCILKMTGRKPSMSSSPAVVFKNDTQAQPAPEANRYYHPGTGVHHLSCHYPKFGPAPRSTSGVISRLNSPDTSKANGAQPHPALNKATQYTIH